MQGAPLILLLLLLSLTGCSQESGNSRDIPFGGGPTATFTPFQAVTSTAAPTITALPTTAPSATPIACSEITGRIEQHEVAFGNEAEPFVFRVYLPPCFSVDGRFSYPVLYMIHGQTFNDDQWDRLGLDEAADALISTGSAPPFLIVMPREKDTFADIFTSPFSSELVEGLVPWIDANYPTCAERTCRAIGGLSRGGAWAFRLGFLHWDRFGAIGLHSTPPFIGDPENLPRWLGAIPPESLPRIYIDTGKQDWYIVSTSRLEGLLVQYRIPHEWYLFNGTHEEAYWSAHVTDYLSWYTRPWKDMLPH